MLVTVGACVGDRRSCLGGEQHQDPLVLAGESPSAFLPGYEEVAEVYSSVTHRRRLDGLGCDRMRGEPERPDVGSRSHTRWLVGQCGLQRGAGFECLPAPTLPTPNSIKPETRLLFTYISDGFALTSHGFCIVRRHESQAEPSSLSAEARGTTEGSTRHSRPFRFIRIAEATRSRKGRTLSTPPQNLPIISDSSSGLPWPTCRLSRSGAVQRSNSP